MRCLLILSKTQTKPGMKCINPVESNIKERSESNKTKTSNPWMYQVSRDDKFIYKELYLYLIKVFFPAENITNNKEPRKNLQKDLISYCSRTNKKIVNDLSPILKILRKKSRNRKNQAANEIYKPNSYTNSIVVSCTCLKKQNIAHLIY